MPHRKKNYVGAKSIRAKKIRQERRMESAEARVERLTAIRLRAALMRAEENEEARAMRRKKDRDNMARRRDNKAAAEAGARRAEIFRRLLSTENSDVEGKIKTENIDDDSEYSYEMCFQAEVSDHDKMDPIKCVETH